MAGDSGQTLTVEPRRDRGGPRSQPHLFVALEAARPMAGGARCSLAGARRVALGRGDTRAIERKDGEVAISIPDSWMSGEHANIVRTPSGWLVEDRGSKNGVSVNGKRYDRRYLADRDVVELGRTFVVLRTGLATPPSSPDTADSQTDPSTPGFSSLLPPLCAVFDQAAKMATTTAAITILGATGTGKELCAQALHAASGRSGPFVAVNCGALADSVLESELFGHVAGAYSGADTDRAGLIASADGGTLFLDEVGELGPKAQAALLRVLQEQEVRPVGSNRTVPVDVRVLSATHRPVAELATSGDFREDLLARLTGFELVLPSLAARRADLGHIVAALLPRLCERPDKVTFDEDLARALFAYSWPRNVRELESNLRRALTLGNGSQLEAGFVDPSIGTAEIDHSGARSAGAAEVPEHLGAEDTARRSQLVELLGRHAGNVSAVARDMGALRQTVQKWLKRYGVDARDYRD